MLSVCLCVRRIPYLHVFGRGVCDAPNHQRGRHWPRLAGVVLDSAHLHASLLQHLTPTRRLHGLTWSMTQLGRQAAINQ